MDNPTLSTLDDLRAVLPRNLGDYQKQYIEEVVMYNQTIIPAVCQMLEWVLQPSPEARVPSRILIRAKSDNQVMQLEVVLQLLQIHHIAIRHHDRQSVTTAQLLRFNDPLDHVEVLVIHIAEVPEGLGWFPFVCRIILLDSPMPVDLLDQAFQRPNQSGQLRWYEWKSLYNDESSCLSPPNTN